MCSRAQILNVGANYREAAGWGEMIDLGNCAGIERLGSIFCPVECLEHRHQLGYAQHINETWFEVRQLDADVARNSVGS